MRPMWQSFFYLILVKHTQANSFRREASSVSRMRQEIHGQLKPVLPSNDAQQGLDYPFGVTLVFAMRVFKEFMHHFVLLHEFLKLNVIN